MILVTFCYISIVWIELSCGQAVKKFQNSKGRGKFKFHATPIIQNIYISARCMKQIIDLAKGWAIVNGNEYVSHQDIKDTIPYILRHRIKFLNQQDKLSYVNKEILEKINIG